MTPTPAETEHPLGGKELAHIPYEEAKHDLAIAAPALFAASLLAGIAYEYIDHLEKQAFTHATEALRQYTADVRTAAVLTVDDQQIRTTQAGVYAYNYQARLRERVPEATRDLASQIVQAARNKPTLALSIERVMESDSVLRLGDEIDDTAEEIAGGNKLIQTGRQVHAQLSRGPLTQEHLDSLQGAASGLLHGVAAHTPLSLLEQPVKRFVTALRESPEGLRQIIGIEFDKQIPPGQSVLLSEESIRSSLQILVADMGIEVPSSFNWDDLATAITAEYAIQHADELFGLDASGQFNTPSGLKRAGVVLEMIGSLDHGQNQRSLLNEPAGTDSSRRN